MATQFKQSDTDFTPSPASSTDSGAAPTLARAAPAVARAMNAVPDAVQESTLDELANHTVVSPSREYADLRVAEPVNAVVKRLLSVPLSDFAAEFLAATEAMNVTMALMWLPGKSEDSDGLRTVQPLDDQSEEREARLFELCAGLIGKDTDAESLERRAAVIQHLRSQGGFIGDRPSLTAAAAVEAPEAAQTRRKASGSVATTLQPYGVPVPNDISREMMIRLAICNSAWKAEDAAGDDNGEVDRLSETRRKAFDNLMQSPSDSPSVVEFKLLALMARFEGGVIEPEEFQPIYDDLRSISARPRAPIEIDLSSPFNIALSAYHRADKELQAFSDNVHDPLVEALEGLKRPGSISAIAPVELKNAEHAESHAQRRYDVLLHMRSQLLDVLVSTEVETLADMHQKLTIMEGTITEGRDAHEFASGMFFHLLNDVDAIGDPS